MKNRKHDMPSSSWKTEARSKSKTRRARTKPAVGSSKSQLEAEGYKVYVADSLYGIEYLINEIEDDDVHQLVNDLLGEY